MPSSVWMMGKVHPWRQLLCISGSMGDPTHDSSAIIERARLLAAVSLWLGCPQTVGIQQTLQGPNNDTVEDQMQRAPQGTGCSGDISCAIIRSPAGRSTPVEISHQGADVAGRVLLAALPLALPDVVDVPPEPLRP